MWDQQSQDAQTMGFPRIGLFLIKSGKSRANMDKLVTLIKKHVSFLQVCQCLQGKS